MSNRKNWPLTLKHMRSSCNPGMISYPGRIVLAAEQDCQPSDVILMPEEMEEAGFVFDWDNINPTSSESEDSN